MLRPEYVVTCKVLELIFNLRLTHTSAKPVLYYNIRM